MNQNHVHPPTFVGQSDQQYRLNDDYSEQKQKQPSNPIKDSELRSTPCITFFLDQERNMVLPVLPPPLPPAQEEVEASASASAMPVPPPTKRMWQAQKDQSVDCAIESMIYQELGVRTEPKATPLQDTRMVSNDIVPATSENFPSNTVFHSAPCSTDLCYKNLTVHETSDPLMRIPCRARGMPADHVFQVRCRPN